jgi:hypothetical protein
LLRINIGMQGFNGGELVTPDFTGQDLFSPFFDIELPAGSGFDHRDGKLPVAVSDNKMRRISFDNGVMTNFPVAQEAIDGIRINAFRGRKSRQFSPSRLLIALSFCSLMALASASVACRAC